MEVPRNQILIGDCLERMRELPDCCVNTCVTSPPYFGLRDYKRAGQIGQEKTPAEFVARLVEVFREVRRVLRNDGTLWLNLGDSYAAGAKNRTPAQAMANSTLKGGKQTQGGVLKQQNKIVGGLKPKDLIGIPWKVAFALQADGWYLRSDIVWSKSNPMPESVQDRPSRSHEFIFLLSKSPKYYYDADAIREPAAQSSIARWNQDVESQAGSARGNGGAKTNGTMKAVGGPRLDKQRGHSRRHAGFNDRWDSMPKEEQQAFGRNKRDVWTVGTAGYKGAHFAVFPPRLIEPCILAGCPVGGLVLDCFGGSGTTAQVAKHLGRDYIITELNPDYAALAEVRIATPLKPAKVRKPKPKPVTAGQLSLFAKDIA
jgi:DNA modification methylase